MIDTDFFSVRSRSRSCCLALVLALSGCAGQPSTADPLTVAEAPAGPWFCEPAIDGGWDCTDDPAAVANPTPARSLASVLNAAPEPLVLAEQTLVAVSDSTMAASEKIVLPAGLSEETAEETAEAAAARAIGSADLDNRSVQPTALLDLPSDFYTVQVLAMSSPTSLERFFDTLGIDSLAAAEVEVDGVLRYVLLLGVYEEFADAQQAAANLPESLADEDPWIRRLGGLQAAMRRANRRRGD